MFVGGNGGSAAIANHLTCDIQKGCRPEKLLRVHSLSCNTPLITAIANDIGYDQTLKHQLESHFEYLSDVVVLISSSGKSPNIVEAAKYTKEQGIILIGMTGFTGGPLKELSDISIHVDSYDFGHIEDTHSHVTHSIARYIRQSLSQ